MQWFVWKTKVNFVSLNECAFLSNLLCNEFILNHIFTVFGYINSNKNNFVHLTVYYFYTTTTTWF